MLKHATCNTCLPVAVNNQVASIVFPLTKNIPAIGYHRSHYILYWSHLRSYFYQPINDEPTNVCNIGIGTIVVVLVINLMKGKISYGCE